MSTSSRCMICSVELSSSRSKKCILPTWESVLETEELNVKAWKGRSDFACKGCYTMCWEIYDISSKLSRLKSDLNAKVVSDKDFFPERDNSDVISLSPENELNVEEDKKREESVTTTTVVLCKQCDTKCESKRSLCLHYREIHNRYLCRALKCSSEFDSASQLKHHCFTIHERLKNAKGDFECEICPKQFQSRSQLIDHDKVHFGKRHRCPVCPKAFISIQRLSLHKKSHINERNEVCDTCGKRFLTKATLKVHQSVHDPVRTRKFTCDVCFKPFFSQGALSNHVTTHITERSFMCPTCGKTFTSNKSLNQHLLIHFGEKNFVCEFEGCDKRFRKKVELANHERSHTGQRPFQCHHCGRSFTNQSNLYSHIRCTHLQVKDYTCDVCGKGFKRKRILECHRKSNRCKVVRDKKRAEEITTVALHFYCSVCENVFQSENELLEHNSREHEEEEEEGYSNLNGNEEGKLIYIVNEDEPFSNHENHDDSDKRVIIIPESI